MKWYNIATQSPRVGSTTGGETPKDWSLRCLNSVHRCGYVADAARPSRWVTSPPTRSNAGHDVSSVKPHRGEHAGLPTLKQHERVVGVNMRLTSTVVEKGRSDGGSVIPNRFKSRPAAGMPRTRSTPWRWASAGRPGTPSARRLASEPARLSVERLLGAFWSVRLPARRAGRPIASRRLLIPITAVRSMCAGCAAHVIAHGIEQNRRRPSTHRERASVVTGRDLAIRRARASAGAL